MPSGPSLDISSFRWAVAQTHMTLILDQDGRDRGWCRERLDRRRLVKRGHGVVNEATSEASPDGADRPPVDDLYVHGRTHGVTR